MEQQRRSLPALRVITPSLWESQVVDGSAATPIGEEVLEGTLVPRQDVNLLRERLQRRGASTLSNTELLSITLHTGQESEHIVPQIDALLTSLSLHQLLNADFGELCQQYRLGEAKAAQLQAVLEVARRLTLPSQEERYTVVSPFDAANLVRREMELLDHEELRVLLLNTKNQVVGNLLLYQGTIDSSVLRAAEVFRPAVARKCPHIIVCHNHPSGDPTPSPEDITVTEQLVQAGKFLDIDVLDHLIIGKDSRFVSLKERLRW